jgi:hypothetical protein
MRPFLRPLLFVLAIAWRFETAVAKGLRPLKVAFYARTRRLRRLKAAARRLVAKLSPKAAIAVVALPGLVLVPLKLLGLWLLAGGAWFSAVLMLVLLKLVGLGMTGFTFRLCRAKLLELHSFRRLSLALRRLRGRLHELIARVRPQSQATPRLLRLARRMRRKIRAAGSAGGLP